MTTIELITDEIVRKAVKAHRDVVSPLVCANGMRAAILAIQDDITRPYKQDAEAYEKVLKEIRNKKATICSTRECNQIADAALKGDYHKTDFTKYCEQNPITEK